MIQFLKKLLKGLVKSGSEPKPTANISETESISRFVTSKGYIAKTKGIVKYGAFLPNKNGETSVYRISDISDEEIWDIGENYVRVPIANKQGTCNLHGRGDFGVQAITSAVLAIEPKPNPHPRHADILDWPEDKEKKQMAATELANNATLHLPPK